MPQYKRNQVEEAIARVLEPKSKEPSLEIRTRLKRLLDTDRALVRSANADLKYAFYSADAPGSGVEVWFEEYEGYALLNGLRLMQHGWTQGAVVSTLRRLRTKLEKEHVRILKLDASKIFDREALRRKAKVGDMAFDTTHPVLLTIVSKAGEALNDLDAPLECAICDGPQEAMKFAAERSGGRGAWTMFEMTTVAHALSNALQRTEPRSRGRS